MVPQRLRKIEYCATNWLRRLVALRAAAPREDRDVVRRDEWRGHRIFVDPETRPLSWLNFGGRDRLSPRPGCDNDTRVSV